MKNFKKINKSNLKDLTCFSYESKIVENSENNKKIPVDYKNHEHVEHIQNTIDILIKNDVQFDYETNIKSKNKVIIKSLEKLDAYVVIFISDNDKCTHIYKPKSSHKGNNLYQLTDILLNSFEEKYNEVIITGDSVFNYGLSYVYTIAQPDAFFFSLLVGDKNKGIEIAEHGSEEEFLKPVFEQGESYYFDILHGITILELVERNTYFEKLEILQDDLNTLKDAKKVYKDKVKNKEEVIAHIRSKNVILEENVKEHWSGIYETFRFKINENSKCIFELTYALGKGKKYCAEELTIDFSEYTPGCHYSNISIKNILVSNGIKTTEEKFDIIETTENIENSNVDLVNKIKELDKLEKTYLDKLDKLEKLKNKDS